MEIVTGYVEHIVFRNEENGYTVFQLESEAGEVTCVGTLNFISEGERLEIKGDYVNHNIYGSQLKISSYEMKEPEDLISIERYLGSGAINVDHFIYLLQPFNSRMPSRNCSCMVQFFGKCFV